MSRAAKTGSVAETLQKALRLHQAGQLDKAARLYGTILKKNPDNGDALNLKGMVAQAHGRHDDALALFGRAITALPDFADVHFNKANTLKALGRNDDALAAYAKAIALKPDYADARLNAGTLLQKMDRTTEAIAAFREMARFSPADPRGHYSLGVCLTEALPAAKSEEREAMTEEADAAFIRTVTLNPNNADAHFAHANLYSKQGDHDRAIQCNKAAIDLKPNWPEAWSNLGSHLEASGDPAAAEAAFDHAIKLDPRNTAALVNRGLSQLAGGRLDKGWDGYARRFETAHALYTGRDWPWPPWQGEPLAGKKIFVWSDQGIGDEILYGSMIPEVIRAANACTVECASRLTPLYRRSFPRADIIPKNPAANTAILARAFDYHCSVLDLGRWLRRSFRAFPNSKRFLFADSQQSESLRQRYRARSPQETLLIGLSWRSVNAMFGLEKSLDLADFIPILVSPRVYSVNLQYGATRQEVEKVKAKHNVSLICDDKIDSLLNLDAFAAQISALDAVVTISNTTAHMAAALGVPTFLIVPGRKKHLWYWFRQGEFSPWYRSVTILRGESSAAIDKLSILFNNL